MKVLTILARHGTAQYGSAREEIAELFRRRLSGVHRKVIVVDNAMEGRPAEVHRDHTVIAGDNRAREFSAFDEGLAFAGAEVRTFDLVHFGTSAFHTLYVGYLDRFSEPLLSEAAGHGICLGHIDCYNEPVEILGHRTQHWIRTAFFFLPPRAATALGSFVSVDDSRRFFSGDPRSPFSPDAPLSATYRRYILEWLTGRDIGQGAAWHSGFKLTAETLPAFESKALSIINEQLLSVRLQQTGCHLVDVTWLSAMAAGARLPPDWWTTPWREQLANRDRDRVVVTRS